MKQYVYLGKPTNLGRFGAVKSGDLLVLTEAEARSVISDARFSLYGPKAGVPDVRPDRKAHAAQNDPDRVRALEIEQMNRDQLVDYARTLGITVRPRTTHRELFLEVALALRNQ